MSDIFDVEVLSFCFVLCNNKRKESEVYGYSEG